LLSAALVGLTESAAMQFTDVTLSCYALDECELVHTRSEIFTNYSRTVEAATAEEASKIADPAGPCDPPPTWIAQTVP
jgi:hypothetical protein